MIHPVEAIWAPMEAQLARLEDSILALPDIGSLPLHRLTTPSRRCLLLASPRRPFQLPAWLVVRAFPARFRLPFMVALPRSSQAVTHTHLCITKAASQSVGQ